MYIVYTQDNCQNCSKAKMLLAAKGLEYIEVAVYRNEPPDVDPSISLAELSKKIPGVRSVPQITYRYQEFPFGERVIGGYEDLKKYIVDPKP